MRLLLPLLLGTALAGCSMAPKYVRPDLPVPASWPTGDAYLQQSEAALRHGIDNTPNEEQVQALGLENVTVCRARAQEAPFAEAADQVTARAVSALRTLIPLVAPLAKPGGELVLMKGASAAREIEEAAKQIRAFGLSDVRVVTLGEGLLEQPTWVVRATVD